MAPFGKCKLQTAIAYRVSRIPLGQNIVISQKVKRGENVR